MSTVYGCHNRAPLKTEAVVRAGSVPVGRNVMAMSVKTIPDPMTKHCNYTHTELGQADAKCEGCMHRAEQLSEAQS